MNDGNSDRRPTATTGVDEKKIPGTESVVIGCRFGLTFFVVLVIVWKAGISVTVPVDINIGGGSTPPSATAAISFLFPS